jgi:hypothetical protein
MRIGKQCLVIAVLAMALAAPTAANAASLTFGQNNLTSSAALGSVQLDLQGYYTTYTSNSAPYAYLTKALVRFDRPGRAHVKSFRLGCNALGLFGQQAQWDPTYHACSVPTIGGSTGWYSWTPARVNVEWATGGPTRIGVACKAKTYDYAGNYLGLWTTPWVSETP